MKPYAASTNKGRTVAGEDIQHRTADQPRKAAKAQKHAARQEGRRVAKRATAASAALNEGCESAAAQKGRPKLPPGKGRTEVIRMRATPAEKAAYAARGGDGWLRQALGQPPASDMPVGK